MAWGSILSLILASSVVATIIQLYFENRRFKIERESLLNKEIYFNLQKKAEILFKEMSLLCNQVNQIFNNIQNNTSHLGVVTVDAEKRIEELSSVQPYFSRETLNLRKNCLIEFQKIRGIYATWLKNKTLTEIETNDLNSASKNFEGKIHVFEKAIHTELHQSKIKIIETSSHRPCCFCEYSGE